MTEKILIVDFGSQFTQLIGRRIREMNVYCEIYPYNNVPELDSSIKGVILSGSPFSVLDKNAPNIDLSQIKSKVPLLSICYGSQLLATKYGGTVKSSHSREYGRAILNIKEGENKLLRGIDSGSQVWMSHGDTITSLPLNSVLLASTQETINTAYKIADEETYGVQFHPETSHTQDGTRLLHNFVIDICNCKANWTPATFTSNTVKDLKERLGNDKVILGLSGGVDSTVAAVLLNQAIGERLHCIFVDNGLLRKNEFEDVMHSYRALGLNITGVRAQDKFLEALKGISDPEQKRKTIGRLFINIFDAEAAKIKDVSWLAQGTIYPDVIESASIKGSAGVIKSHHNVGGLPDYMKLKIVEPLRTLFKDEVRRVGQELGIDKSFLSRHPFPGPGLGIRLIGEITAEKLNILKEADAIYIDLLRSHNLYHKVWQAAAILLPIKSVGVMGDERTYEYTLALRAVTSVDGMTADWVHLPYDFLATVSNEIINRVRGINRVVYDISSKPPATIEWE